MPTLEVLPRPTPEERAETIVPVDVEDELATFAETIEEWAAPRPSWEFPLQDEEEVVGVGMRMPDELALHLHDGELVVVVVADDPRREVLIERRQLRGEVDRLVHGY